MTVRRNIVVASATAAVLLALAGCSSGSGGGETPAAGGGDGSVEGKEICYITAANSHPYVTPANEGAQAAADAAGVELTIVSEEFSAQTGAEQLNTCVSRK